MARYTCIPQLLELAKTLELHSLVHSADKSKWNCIDILQNATYSPRELFLDNCFHSHTNSEKRLLTCDLSLAKIVLLVCNNRT